MNDIHRIERDLQYVRSAVERADACPTPRLICFLWAALGGTGFALVDLREAWVPTYWTVAGPGGFLVSAALGWRHAARIGHASTKAGLRHVFHWGGMLAAIFLVGLMPAAGAMPWSGVGPAILLLLAVGYFHAGVHLDPALRWIGLLLTAGYVVVLMLPAGGWLTLGVLFAVALVATGLRASRLDAQATA